MINDPIKHIVCAVRGQPESRATAIRAIDLALEHDARLTFCLVIDAEFLGQAAPTLTPLQAVYRQLEDMGKFSMLILCDRAQRRGVKQAGYLIRKGDIPKQLRLVASEIEADVMVLGRPMRRMGRRVFTHAEFDYFVESLEREASMHVIQVIHDKNK